MRMTAYWRRQVTWIALCAVTFSAIAPAISHWIASAADSTWNEICSASGIKRVALDAQSTPVPVDERGSIQHCPFCRPQTDLAILPPSDVALGILAVAQGDARWTPRTQPLHVKRLWAPALSRAPPYLS